MFPVFSTELLKVNTLSSSAKTVENYLTFGEM